MNPALLIRADANIRIGAGHIMRCLAVAEAWKDAGGEVFLAAAEIPPALVTRLASSGIRVLAIAASPSGEQDAAAVLAHAAEQRAAWILVDGDSFESGYLARLRSEIHRVALIDDFASRGSFPVDLVVNPNIGARQEAYRPSAPACLIGSKYVPLRREFRGRRRDGLHAKGNRVLITLGGSDPDNLTVTMVATLAQCAELQLTAVAGPGFPMLRELEALAAQKVIIANNAQNMCELMLNSDLAVIAAGGTLWELLSVGCAVLSYSRNPVQAEVVRALAEDGIVADMGDTARFDPARLRQEVGRLVASSAEREGMADCGARLIDGLGATRIVDTMRQIGARTWLS